MKKNSIDKRIFRNGTYFDSMAWLDVKYEDYLEMCKELEIEPKEEDTPEYFSDLIEYMNDDFGDFESNMKYSKFNDCKCMITGSLGLWWGKPTIVPILCDNLIDAIKKCWGTCDDCEVKLENGHLVVLAKHHDGTNYYEIHLLSANGLREVERPIYKYEKDYEPKSWWFKNIYGYLF
mgnify:CR=1 FL=1